MLKVIAVLLCASALAAQDAKSVSCLAVYPQTADRSISGAAPISVPFILAHADRFLYIESIALPVSDIKPKYKKSDLKNLEARGVKVVVTTKGASGGPSAPAGCSSVQ
jgi:hypothetical protein